MDNQFIKDIILVVIPIVTTSLMGYFTWAMKAMKEKEKEDVKKVNAMREASYKGSRAILLYLLEQLHNDYKKKGYINRNQYQRAKEMYEAYHALGGNGYGTSLWSEIEELEIKNEENII